MGGWMGQVGERLGNSRGSDRKEKMLPGNPCPSSLPPNSGPLYYITLAGPAFPLQHGWHCPTQGRGARSLGCLATAEDLGGGRGPERESNAFLSFGSEEGAYELGLPHTRPRPRYPTFQIVEAATAAPYRSLREEAGFRMLRHCAGRCNGTSQM